jgi:hypothetical protein
MYRLNFVLPQIEPVLSRPWPVKHARHLHQSLHSPQIQRMVMQTVISDLNSLLGTMWSSPGRVETVSSALVRLCVPAQEVDATPSNLLIRQYFRLENRSVRVYSIKTLARMVFRLNQGSQTIFGLLRPCK